MTASAALPPAGSAVERMLATDAFSRWLDILLVAIGAGHCTLRMRVRADMLNGFGVAHGGIVFSLADSAMAFACNSGEFVTVAVDNQIAYPAAIRVDDVLDAEAVEDGSSGRLGFYRVPVRNQDGVIVALFRGTVYRTRRLHEPASIP